LLRATFTSNKIDADALFAVFSQPVPAPGSGTPAESPPANHDRLIPDTPIPFDLLRLANADVTFNAAELRYGGAQYHSIAQHIALHDGILRLDPFAADLAEGHLSGSLVVDATRAPAAAVALRLHAPGLAVGPLLAAIGMPGSANGNLEVYADLNGTGDTPHDIAAGLNGSLGFAMADGTVGNHLLSSTFGEILRATNLLDLAERGGVSQLQCAAARLDLARGTGTLRTLLLSSTLLTLDGEGTVNLGAESVNLLVRSRNQVLDTKVVVPLRVSGPWRSPSVKPDPTATVTENAGTVAGAVIGSTSPLGAVAGALGADKVITRVFGGPVDCPTSLAIARGQASPPPPGHAPAPARTEAKPKAVNPGDLLRQLFH
jgi:AsmA protein